MDSLTVIAQHCNTLAYLRDRDVTLDRSRAASDQSEYTQQPEK